MRVLFVAHAYPRFPADAAGSFLHRLALALREAGAVVQVLAPAGAGLAESEMIDGVPVRRFRYAPRGLETLAYTGTMAEQVLGSLGGKAALAGFLAAGSWALRREIARFAPDVVHAHWWFPAGLLALAGGSGKPLVTTMHGSDVRLARKVSVVHPLMRAVLRRSQAVTAVSSWLADEARAMAPAARIVVAPMPADTAAFAPEGTPVAGRFLFVGRLNAQKGVADLLDAFAQLPTDATLDVVGDGDDRAALHARAASLGVAGRVRWIGHIDRSALGDAYRSAIAVVMPSRDEGLGLVGVEAQLCGTPVIAYRSGGLPDVVDAAWGGTLVEPGDLTGLAAAMRARLVARSAAGGVDASAGAARARMLERFAPREVASRYLALYEQAVRDATA
jgi:glycosyltransferase involved in cell wall biosynthesis